MTWTCRRHGDGCRDPNHQKVIKEWNEKGYKNPIETPEHQKDFLRFLRLK